MVRSYHDLTIKFHDYSSFFTAFDVANLIDDDIQSSIIISDKSYISFSLLHV